MANQKKKREFIGKNKFYFPDDYIVLDIETTGFSPDWYSVMEVSAIKYEDHNEVDRFSSLVKPNRSKHGKYLGQRRVELTGITNEMLANAPNPKKVLPQFKSFLGNSILVGYSVDFDVRFLYDVYQRDYHRHLTNNFVDIHPMIKKAHSGLDSYTLCNVADFYGIENENAHRAENDCVVTALCYEKLREEICNMYDDINDFFQLVEKK